jgi:hypothetical protein
MENSYSGHDNTRERSHKIVSARPATDNLYSRASPRASHTSLKSFARTGMTEWRAATRKQIRKRDQDTDSPRPRKKRRGNIVYSSPTQKNSDDDGSDIGFQEEQSTARSSSGPAQQSNHPPQYEVLQNDHEDVYVYRLERRSKVHQGPNIARPVRHGLDRHNRGEVPGVQIKGQPTAQPSSGPTHRQRQCAVNRKDHEDKPVDRLEQRSDVFRSSFEAAQQPVRLNREDESGNRTEEQQPASRPSCEPAQQSDRRQHASDREDRGHEAVDCLEKRSEMLRSSSGSPQQGCHNRTIISLPGNRNTETVSAIVSPRKCSRKSTSKLSTARMLQLKRHARMLQFKRYNRMWAHSKVVNVVVCIQ